MRPAFSSPVISPTSSPSAKPPRWAPKLHVAPVCGATSICATCSRIHSGTAHGTGTGVRPTLFWPPIGANTHQAITSRAL